MAILPRPKKSVVVSELSLYPKSLQAKSTVLHRLDYKGCLFAVKLNLNPETKPKNFWKST